MARQCVGLYCGVCARFMPVSLFVGWPRSVGAGSVLAFLVCIRPGVPLLVGLSYGKVHADRSLCVRPGCGFCLYVKMSVALTGGN